MRKAVESLGASKNRLAGWFGRFVRRLYDYYLKLEQKIDPVERVLKAIDGVQRVQVTLEPAQAIVEYVPGQVDAARLHSAIEDAGYEFVR